ncbi:hypothetical protein LINPERPRIM_LOCUS8540 [Linum perenne]
MEYYNDDGIFALANKIGAPIRIDRQTALITRGKFARVCVEVNLSKPLIPLIGVEDNWLKVEYEGIPLICLKCSHAGHDSASCTRFMMEEETPPSNVATPTKTDPRNTMGNGLDEGFGNWMVVQPRVQTKRRGQRKTGNQRNAEKSNNSRKNQTNRFATLEVALEETTKLPEREKVEVNLKDFEQLETVYAPVRVETIVTLSKEHDMPLGLRIGQEGLEMGSLTTVVTEAVGSHDNVSPIENRKQGSVENSVKGQAHKKSSSVTVSDSTLISPSTIHCTTPSSQPPIVKVAVEEKKGPNQSEKPPDPKRSNNRKVTQEVNTPPRGTTKLTKSSKILVPSPEARRQLHRSSSPPRRKL